MHFRPFARRLGARLAACGLMAAAPLAAQDRAVSGTITDATTRAPLADVVVSVAGSSRSATSAADGRYTLTGLPAGALELRARRIGYQPLVVRVPAGASAADAALAPAATQLAPVITTANRASESLVDVAAAVSVVDSMVIRNSRSAGLHEVLRYTPGVVATSRFGLDDVNLSIRGSGIRTTFGVRGVAVMVDGVPVTEPDGQTRLDLVELASAKQVEVVRGPASALYGGVASGGVVNIITRSGAESRGVTFRAQRGAFDFAKYDGSVGTTFAGDRGSLYVSGARTEQAGFRAWNTTDLWRWNVRADYRLAARTRVGLDASSSNLNTLIPGAQNAAEFDANPFAALQNPNIVNRYARFDERRRVGLRLFHGFDLAGRPVKTTTYGFYGWRTLEHPIFQVVAQDLDRWQAGTRARIALDRAQDPRATLTVGGDFDRLAGIDQRYVNALGRRGTRLQDNIQRIPSVGAYGQLELRPFEALQLTAGARWDRVRYDIADRLVAARSYQATFEQVSPKFTASWRLARGSQVYASVAKGFEVPTSGELALGPDPNLAFNTALTPKSLWNYEVGLKGTLADRVYAELSVYQADITGEFISRTVPTSAGPRTIFENAGRSRNRGVEAGVTALLTDRLDLVASYTFADYVLQDFRAPVVQPNGQAVLVDFSGRRLPGVPQHRLTGELRARPVDGLQLGLGAEWQGRLFVNNNNDLAGTVYFRPFGPGPVQAVPFRAVEAWGLLHLNASYRLRQATLFASVENLLDARYIANVTVNDGNGRFYNAGAGRYVAVGLSLNGFANGFGRGF
ncbi:MAG: TonB-dependent receptor [Gemmatimonadales bacterium]|nr:TonB-dependent receptor [Gemmatimonadales bacterium]